jgi:hypothetical protein
MRCAPFTPRDQKAVKSAAQTLRANPKFDAEAAIMELGVGEALVSFLDEKGSPTVVERGFVLAPGSRIGPMTPEERKAAMAGSLVAGVYEKVLDRESAYEKLKGDTNQKVGAGDTAAQAPAAGTAPAQPKAVACLVASATCCSAAPARAVASATGLAQTMAKTVVRTIGSQVGREIVRGVLGSIMGGRRR